MGHNSNSATDDVRKLRVCIYDLERQVDTYRQALNVSEIEITQLTKENNKLRKNIEKCEGNGDVFVDNVCAAAATTTSQAAGSSTTSDSFTILIDRCWKLELSNEKYENEIQRLSGELEITNFELQKLTGNFEACQNELTLTGDQLKESWKEIESLKKEKAAFLLLEPPPPSTKKTGEGGRCESCASKETSLQQTTTKLADTNKELFQCREKIRNQTQQINALQQKIRSILAAAKSHASTSQNATVVKGIKDKDALCSNKNADLHHQITMLTAERDELLREKTASSDSKKSNSGEETSSSSAKSSETDLSVKNRELLNENINLRLHLSLLARERDGLSHQAANTAAVEVLHQHLMQQQLQQQQHFYFGATATVSSPYVHHRLQGPVLYQQPPVAAQTPPTIPILSQTPPTPLLPPSPASSAFYGCASPGFVPIPLPTQLQPPPPIFLPQTAARHQNLIMSMPPQQLPYLAESVRLMAGNAAIVSSCGLTPSEPPQQLDDCGGGGQFGGPKIEEVIVEPADVGEEEESAAQHLSGVVAGVDVVEDDRNKSNGSSGISESVQPPAECSSSSTTSDETIFAIDQHPADVVNSNMFYQNNYHPDDDELSRMLDRIVIDDDDDQFFDEEFREIVAGIDIQDIIDSLQQPDDLSDNRVKRDDVMEGF